ncbi:MAG: hypothetical protein AAF849_02585 [Bacteroidota bacterium]
MENWFYNFTLFALGETKKQPPFIGARPLLVLVAAKTFDEEAQTLLGKMLTAIQLEMDKDIFLLQIRNDEAIHFHSYPCLGVLSFGIPLNQLGIHYRMQSYQLLDYDGRQFLKVDALSKIAKDRNLKTALWNELKKLGSRLKKESP